MSTFDGLRRALDEVGSMGNNIDVFFRDDDADQDLPNLRRLLDVFLDRAAPLNLEVIPGTLTDHGADLLFQRHEEAPALIELNQHGWMHENHELTGRSCEFGPSRSYEQQLLDIRRGRERLDQVFGDAWRAVFTPPWNRCTSDTVKAVDELGFVAISKDAPESAVSGRVREISTTFDLYRWKTGAQLKPAFEIDTILAGQVKTLKRVGILLHHKVMTLEAFRAVEALLGEFRRSPAVRLHTFNSALNILAPTEASSCNA